ncbi:helix-turn-helix domain-containing protein [Rufibacter quisquiliarum]|uniref:Transcriptional regulator with XRE-family HTH domain n=1 Tax=Rufibacter quisquiliarum TaxID=1549639 RepID=A0A839GQC1_9BACT|nr:helix-turn-helix transcriptional regulator [Rufibacter quisquiliarum]MBA9077076.1 transcriptional regulator with XRE-family HTH domain [Rufibacter quisquiliarum]
MARLRNQRLIGAVAARVKQLREAKGVTLEVVFLDTGIHLARLEAGRANVTLSTLEAVCQYLGVTLEEFFSKGFEELGRRTQRSN